MILSRINKNKVNRKVPNYLISIYIVICEPVTEKLHENISIIESKFKN